MKDDIIASKGAVRMLNLLRLREKRRLTQVALHIVTGIDQSLLSKYERGERLPSVSDLMILADFFHTSLDFLMDRTDEEAPYPPAGKTQAK